MSHKIVSQTTQFPQTTSRTGESPKGSTCCAGASALWSDNTYSALPARCGVLGRSAGTLEVAGTSVEEGEEAGIEALTTDDHDTPGAASVAAFWRAEGLGDWFCCCLTLLSTRVLRLSSISSRSLIR